MKNYIKRKIVDFWEEHRDFNDRNPQHIREAEELLRRLAYDFPPSIIREAVLELQEEASVEVERARRRFYENLEEASEGAENRTDG